LLQFVIGLVRTRLFCTPAFSLRMIAGATALGGLEIPHCLQQPVVVHLASH